MTPLVADSDFTLYVGDVRDVLRELEDESVHCVVTSPPYWGLRDYGTGTWIPDGCEGAGWDGACTYPKCKCNVPRSECDHETVAARGGRGGSGAPGKQTAGAFPSEFAAAECGKCGARRVDQQLGLESTPDQYIENMVGVFREVRRVLRRDGTCWLNIGDSYAGSGPTNHGGGSSTLNNDGRSEESRQRVVAKIADDLGQVGSKTTTRVPGLKPKDLCGMPWRLAFALQQDGWYLRAEIIWAKPNPMPESVTDRPTKAHEQVFLLTRSPRYFYDADAVREPRQPGPNTADDATSRNGWTPKKVGDDLARPGMARRPDLFNPAGRNLRSVWEIPTEPFPQAHFATYPQALVERCVKAGTSERGCCPECGAPWERETESQRVDLDGTIVTGAFATDAGKSASAGPRPHKHTTTLGWKPTCDCVEPDEFFRLSIPCTVFDPFIGSGTTALVARRLGRKCIGIELSPDYAQICLQRTRQLSLLAEAAQ